jgi:hypothetical protein
VTPPPPFLLHLERFIISVASEEEGRVYSNEIAQDLLPPSKLMKLWRKIWQGLKPRRRQSVICASSEKIFCPYKNIRRCLNKFELIIIIMGILKRKKLLVCLFIILQNTENNRWVLEMGKLITTIIYFPAMKMILRYIIYHKVNTFFLGPTQVEANITIKFLTLGWHAAINVLTPNQIGFNVFYFNF